MKANQITVTKSLTVNLGNFENFKNEIAVNFEVDGDSVLKDLVSASDLISKRLYNDTVDAVNKMGRGVVPNIVGKRES